MQTTLKLSNTLKSNKELTYRVLAQIASSVPAKVKFDQVEYNGGTLITIQGIAASDQDILKFIENLGKQKLVDHIDFKNMDLKNLSMDDIKAKLQAVEKKTWIKIGIVFGAVVLFLIIYYGVLSPIVERKKAQVVDMNLKKEETTKIIKDINLSKKKIK